MIGTSVCASSLCFKSFPFALINADWVWGKTSPPFPAFWPYCKSCRMNRLQKGANTDKSVNHCSSDDRKTIWRLPLLEHQFFGAVLIQTAWYGKRKGSWRLIGSKNSPHLHLIGTALAVIWCPTFSLLSPLRTSSHLSSLEMEQHQVTGKEVSSYSWIALLSVLQILHIIDDGVPWTSTLLHWSASLKSNWTRQASEVPPAR